MSRKRSLRSEEDPRFGMHTTRDGLNANTLTISRINRKSLHMQRPRHSHSHAAPVPPTDPSLPQLQGPHVVDFGTVPQDVATGRRDNHSVSNAWTPKRGNSFDITIRPLFTSSSPIPASTRNHFVLLHRTLTPSITLHTTSNFPHCSHALRLPKLHGYPHRPPPPPHTLQSHTSPPHTTATHFTPYPLLYHPSLSYSTRSDMPLTAATLPRPRTAPRASAHESFYCLRMYFYVPP